MSDRGAEIIKGAVIGILCAVGAVSLVGLLAGVMMALASVIGMLGALSGIIASAALGAGIAYWRTRGQAWRRLKPHQARIANEAAQRAKAAAAEKSPAPLSEVEA